MVKDFQGAVKPISISAFVLSRVDDCGPSRLHIDALVLDPFYGVQGKFLKILGLTSNGHEEFSSTDSLGSRLTQIF